MTGHLLLSGILCLSCTEKPDDPLGSGIVLEEGTRTEQVVYANDKDIKNEGIRFTAQGPWKAEASTVKRVEWLASSQMSTPIRLFTSNTEIN